MDLQTYLMIKQANEAIKRDIGTGLMRGFGLSGSRISDPPGLPRNNPGATSGLMSDFSKPNVGKRNTDALRKRIQLMLAPLGMGEPLRYR